MAATCFGYKVAIIRSCISNIQGNYIPIVDEIPALHTKVYMTVTHRVARYTAVLISP